MFKEVTIGGITVPMLANGATPIRYKHIFHKDIISEFQAAQEDYSKVVNSIPELAFVMAKQAEAKEGKVNLDLLNEAMYMTWAEQFGAMDLPLAADDIINLYLGNNATSSESKKKAKEKQNVN